MAAIWLSEATSVHHRNGGVTGGQRPAPAIREPDDDQPQRRERQAIEKAHQRRAERAEIAGQMALRRIAQRLRQRRADRDRYPGPGDQCGLPLRQRGLPDKTAGASGSDGACVGLQFGFGEPHRGEKRLAHLGRLPGLEDVALQVAAAERVAQELARARSPR